MTRYLFVIAISVAAACITADCSRAADPAPKPAARPANDPTRAVPGNVRWFMPSHNRYLQQTKTKKIEVCFLGDSITQMWPGYLFDKYYGKLNAVNFGVGGDRIENVLWRLENGELKGTSPKVIVLLIGTNNMGFNTADEIAEGVTNLVKKLNADFPKTRILLLGIFPKKDPVEAKRVAANKLIAKLDDNDKVRFLDISAKFLDKDGAIQGGVLKDAVHPTDRGFVIWADAMNPLLKEMLDK